MAEFPNKLAEKNAPLIQDRNGFTGSIFEANELAAMRAMAERLAAGDDLSGLRDVASSIDPAAPSPPAEK